MRLRVLCISGCTEAGMVWSQLMSFPLSLGGIYVWSVRHSVGTWYGRVLVISLLKSHWMALTQQLEGKMCSGSSFFSSSLAIWDSVSVLWFFDLGQYAMTKLKRLKKSTHLTWLGFILLVNLRYLRFLWLVHKINGWLAPSSQYLCSASVSLTARSLRSPTLLFRSALVSFCEKNATGCNFGVSLKLWDRIAIPGQCQTHQLQP